MTEISRARLQYMVGGLLYTPAVTEGVAEKIENGAFRCLTSIAFCLEDSIRDEALEKAEQELLKTLGEMKRLSKSPLVFIRIRTPEHLLHIHGLFKEYYDVITGYVLPKFDLSNCSEYSKIITEINLNCSKPVYIMPILESRMIADTLSRAETLGKIKDCLDKIKDYVLNVRVGGNDLSNLYGLRRSTDCTIYDMGAVRDILIDIINVFVPEYVVSGAVWEYFGENENEPWALGLKKELALDRLNGFIGKTAIHPSQLPLIYESMKVNKTDYEDALKILGWKSDTLGVEKSADGTRMNEEKCHGKWALKTAMLGEIYGLKE